MAANKKGLIVWSKHDKNVYKARENKIKKINPSEIGMNVTMV